MKLFSKRKGVDDQINRIMETLDTLDPTSDEYATLCDRLETLKDMKAAKSDWKVWIPLLSTFVAGIFSTYQVHRITKHEEEDIVTTKSLPFIKKMN